MMSERVFLEEEVIDIIERINALGYTGKEREISRMTLSEIEKFLNTIQ